MFHGLAVLRLRAEQDDLRVPSDLQGVSWWPIEKIAASDGLTLAILEKGVSS